MLTLTVSHRTRYTYSAPVRFGSHRLMLRPRDSHDLRLLAAHLSISPPARLSYSHDVFGNSVAVAEFEEPGAVLNIDSAIEIEHYGIDGPSLPMAEFARHVPFRYPASELPDLARVIEPQYDDPNGRVLDWARAVLAPLSRSGPPLTLDVVQILAEEIRRQFTYTARDEEGTQSPIVTLETGSGSCRDFALLLMEVARGLGMAARFVTGYLYDPAVDGGDQVNGAGATHAWTQIYLPGPGWVEIDPTNGLMGGRNLIRVAVARDPTQAVPISGSFDGSMGQALGLDVEVTVALKRDTMQAPAA
ncbi:MAG: transglutaminase family protein [Rhodospirillaceae bacterium]|nr:transglutaminase family protein [Rhodospirillaceae bacterium]